MYYTKFHWMQWNFKELNNLIKSLRKINNSKQILKVRLSSTVLIKEVNKIINENEGMTFNLMVNKLLFNYKIENKKLYVKPVSETTWEIAQYNQYTFDNLTIFLNLLKEVLHNAKKRNFNTDKTLV